MRIEAPSASLRERLYSYSMLIVVVTIFATIAALEPRVMAPNNILNILNQTAYLALFGAAQSIVILTRGFDLSLGTAVSTTIVTALAMSGRGDLWIFAACLVGLGAAALVGLVNGLTIAFLRINPFIVTLATFNILLAASSTISGGSPVTGLPARFVELFGIGTLAGLPVAVLLTGTVIAILQFTLKATVFGRSLYLIGSNPQAASVAGIPVRFHLVCAYLLCGLLTGIGAVLLTARTGSGEPNLGGTLTLQTIAAAVVGGMSLRGGEGSMLAPLSGALFVTVLSNGMNLLQLDGYLQEIVLGALVVGALCLDRFRRSTRQH